MDLVPLDIFKQITEYACYRNIKNWVSVHATSKRFKEVVGDLKQSFKKFELYKDSLLFKPTVARNLWSRLAGLFEQLKWNENKELDLGVVPITLRDSLLIEITEFMQLVCQCSLKDGDYIMCPSCRKSMLNSPLEYEEESGGEFVDNIRLHAEKFGKSMADINDEIFEKDTSIPEARFGGSKAFFVDKSGNRCLLSIWTDKENLKGFNYWLFMLKLYYLLLSVEPGCVLQTLEFSGLDEHGIAIEGLDLETESSGFLCVLRVPQCTLNRATIDFMKKCIEYAEKNHKMIFLNTWICSLNSPFTFGPYNWLKVMDNKDPSYQSMLEIYHYATGNVDRCENNLKRKSDCISADDLNITPPKKDSHNENE
jgi:hypothetical protein